MLYFSRFPFFSYRFTTQFLWKAHKWHKDPQFWITFLLGFLIIGLSRGIHWGVLLRWTIAPEDWFLLRSSINWAMKLIMVIIFLALFIRLLTLLWDIFMVSLLENFMLPLILCFWNCLCIYHYWLFFSDLQNYYPRYKVTHGLSFANHHNVSTWVPILIYEASYATSFITVEFLFRGF